MKSSTIDPQRGALPAPFAGAWGRFMKPGSHDTLARIYGCGTSVR